MSARKTIPVAIFVVILTLMYASVAMAGSAKTSGVFQSPVDTPTPTATSAPTATPTATATPGSTCGTGSWLITAVTGGKPLAGSEFTNDTQFTINALSCPGMTAAEVYIHYDPNIVAPVDIPGVGVVEIVPDFFGASNFSVNEVLLSQCPASIGSPCLHVIVAGPAQYNKTGSAIRPHWRCTALGTAVFTGRATFVNADGYTIPVNNPVSAQVTCSALALKGRVLRQGVNGNQAGTAVVAVGSAYTFGPASTTASGDFTLNNLPEGIYTLRASYPGYLNAEKANVTVSSGNPLVDVGTTRLWGGDANGDCRINILDVGQIISKFGTTGLPASDATDINDDGAVNVSDLAIAAGNWGKTCSTAWLP